MQLISYSNIIYKQVLYFLKAKVLGYFQTKFAQHLPYYFQENVLWNSYFLSQVWQAIFQKFPIIYKQVIEYLKDKVPAFLVGNGAWAGTGGREILTRIWALEPNFWKGAGLYSTLKLPMVRGAGQWWVYTTVLVSWSSPRWTRGPPPFDFESGMGTDWEDAR